VALVFLGLGFWLGWQLISERIAAQRLVAHVADASRIDEQVTRQRATNDALRVEIEQARRTLQGDVCRPGDFGLSPLTPPQITPMQPSSLPPTPQGQAAFTGTLIEMLDQATVLVLGPLANGQGRHGTGFVAPGGATNAHVVAPLDPTRTYVVNRRLGRPVTTSGAQTPDPRRAGDYRTAPPANAPAVPAGLTRRGEARPVAPPASAGDHAGGRIPGAAGRQYPLIPELAVTDGLINAVRTCHRAR
jgi:hypothetical protein